MKKTYLTFIPYLYFIAIILWVFFDNFLSGNADQGTYLMLLFSVPFISQLFLKSKALDVFLIAICLFFTGWMSLAYLSDVADIAEMTNRAKRFLFWGGLLSAGNVLMTGWLFFNLKRKETEEGFVASGTL